MSRDFVVADDVLIALGHFLRHENTDSFDASMEKMHRWFFDHRHELPAKCVFRDQGFGPESEELRQAISNLCHSGLFYTVSGGRNPHRVFIKPTVHHSYMKFEQNRLQRLGFNEEKLRQLAMSFAESCAI